MINLQPKQYFQFRSGLKGYVGAVEVQCTYNHRLLYKLTFSMEDGTYVSMKGFYENGCHNQFNQFDIVSIFPIALERVSKKRRL